jgi:16S rRNA A1518/A1519 N6-dimethyltransferase RsmA/KsgA/DIM1 with predicted DNA glycosylase/AP lyase activity
MARGYTSFATENYKTARLVQTALNGCLNNGIDDIVVTRWETVNSPFAMLPAFYNFIEGCCQTSGYDKEERCECLFGYTYQEFLKLDLPNLLTFDGNPDDGVGETNLPYYITSPIIMKILECGALFESVTVMIQKEVAERLAAAPGDGDYGAITVFAAYLADVEKCFNVSPGNFLPQPKVTSAVIRMKPHKTPPVEVKDPENMQRIIKAAFEQRRKMLAGALSAATHKASKAEISEKIAEAGLSPDVRGEKLSLADFARLSDILEI